MSNDKNEFELDIGFDLDQFNVEGSESSSADNKGATAASGAEVESVAKGDLLQIGDTHVLQNEQDLVKYKPYRIMKVATSAQVTYVVIRPETGPPVVLRYDQQYRLSDFKRWFEVVEISIKQPEYQLDVEQIYLSPSGAYALISFEGGIIYAAHTFTNKQRQTKTNVITLTKEGLLQRTDISSCYISEEQNQCEVLFGSKLGKVYTFRLLRKEKRLSVDGNNGVPKLVHILPAGHKITGLDFHHMDITGDMMNIANKLGPFSSKSPAQIMSADTQQPNYSYNMNLCEYKDTQLMPRRYIILITSQIAVSIIEGRGCSVGDVLLVANQESMLQKSGKVVTLIDKPPIDYQFIAQIPFPLDLSVERGGFLKRDMSQQPIGWVWFSAQQHIGLEKEYNDIVYEEEQARLQDVQDGWNEISNITVKQNEAKEIFSYQKQNSNIATQCFIGQLPQDIIKLYMSCFTTQGKPDAKQFIIGEQSYMQAVNDKVIQSQTIVDQSTIKSIAPTAVLYGQYQFAVAYPLELICVSQITMQCTTKISSEELVLNLIKSPDPTICFNQHDVEAEQQQVIIGFTSDQSQKRSLIYSSSNIYVLYFNDQKELWRDMMEKDKYEEALNMCENSKQTQEVRYYQAQHHLEKKLYNEAATLFGKTPKLFESIFTKFINPTKERGFSTISLGSGRSVAEVYENRDAIICMAESRLNTLNIPEMQTQYKKIVAEMKKQLEIKQKEAQAQSLVIPTHIELSTEDMQKVQNYRRAIIFVFISIQQYLALINELYFCTLTIDVEAPFVDFQIIPTKQKLKSTHQYQIDMYRSQQQLQHLKSRVPSLKQKLVQFITKYSTVLPMQISRTLLTLCSNQEAFEAFTKSVNDIQNLLNFYLQEIEMQQKMMRQDDAIKKQQQEQKDQEYAKQQEQQKKYLKDNPNGTQAEMIQEISRKEIIKDVQYCYYESKFNQVKNLFKYQSSVDHLINQTFLLLSRAEVAQNLALFYQNSHHLFGIAPQRAKDLLVDICTTQKENVEPLLFLPCLLQALSPTQDAIVKQEITKFLHGVATSCGWNQMSIQNLLIHILAVNASDTRATKECQAEFSNLLIQMCKEKQESQNFTYSYALRCLSFFKLNLPTVHLLASNGFLKKAVQLALEGKNYEVAREIALKSPEEEVNSELLLLIAVKMAKDKRSVPEALKFANGSGKRLVRVEHLLQQVDARIDAALKQEIKSSMAEYQSQTEGFKSQIEISHSSTKQISMDLEKLRNRYIYVRKNQLCSYCERKLAADPFIVFDCGHGFHNKCVYQIVRQKGNLDDKSLVQKAIKCMNELGAKYQSNDVEKFELDDQKKYQDAANTLEQLVEKECPYCSIQETKVEQEAQWLQVNETEWKL